MYRRYDDPSAEVYDSHLPEYDYVIATPAFGAKRTAMVNKVKGGWQVIVAYRLDGGTYPTLREAVEYFADGIEPIDHETVLKAAIKAVEDADNPDDLYDAHEALYAAAVGLDWRQERVRA